MTDAARGVFALTAACVIWGLSPLYYKLLSHVPPPELLAHRTFWSFVTFAGVLIVQGKLRRLPVALSGWRNLGRIAVAALMISTNWFLFIVSIQIDHATEASLGYYIFPLVAALLGVVFFGEPMGRGKATALSLATVAVLVLTLGLGVAPWISLVLATTFGLYGLIKKSMTVGPIISVTAEVLLLLPFAAGWLLWLEAGQGGAFGRDAFTTLMLACSGGVTALPLILFSYASQRCTLATVGLVQYLNPTLQFLCAVLVFGEPFGPYHAAAFGLIWTALAIYSADTLRNDRARRKLA